MKKPILIRIINPFIQVAKHSFRSPMTHKYPFERQRGFPRTRGRHILIIDKCTGCGVCAWICPNKAITMVTVEGRELTHPQIDYGRCCFCGFCVEYCPRSAIIETNIVEIASYKRDQLIFDPIRLSEKPDIKELLPEMKYELVHEIDPKIGIKYIKRRVKR